MQRAKEQQAPALSVPRVPPKAALLTSCPLLSPSISPPFKFHFLLSCIRSLLGAKVACHVPDCKSTNVAQKSI